MSRVAFFEWDPREIRVLVCDLRARHRKVIAGGAISADELSDESLRMEQIGPLLKDWLATNKLGKMPAVGVLNRTQVETCLLDLPPASDSELPELVANQAVRQAPAISEDAPLDYLPLPSEEGEPRRALAVAAPAELVTQLKEVTKQAGLTLQSLVVRSIAAARAIPPETMATGTTLVVCPVGDWVDLTLLADGHPLLARTVRPSAAADSESWNQRVVAEVRRTLLAAPSGALPEGNIDRIVVLTPPHDADDTSVGLGQFLQQQLVTQVGTLDVSSSLDAEALAQLPRAERFVGLLSVAAEHGRAKQLQLDLLNPRKPPRRLERRQKIVFVAAAVATLFLGGWYTLSSQLAQLDGQVDQLQRRKRELDDTLASTAKQRELAQELTAWEGRSVNWLEELRDFSTRVPDENHLVIQRMSLTPSRALGGAIDIQGVVRDPATVVQLEQKLRDEFHEIRSKRVQERGRGQDYTWHFESAIAVKPRTTEQYAQAAGLIETKPVAEKATDKAPRQRAKSRSSDKSARKRR